MCLVCACCWPLNCVCSCFTRALTHWFIGVLLFVFSSGDFAKVITTLQQPYNRMSIHALITLSIQSIKDRNNPNARKHPSSSSFRRERGEKVMKNVAGVVNEKASNLYGSLKHWASEKKKKKKGGGRLENAVVGGGVATKSTATVNRSRISSGWIGHRCCYNQVFE